MPRLTRRTFLGWLGAVGALVGARRGRASSVSDAAQPAGLDPAVLLALAEAVLPGELGPGGTARAAREFARWIAEYRPGAELLHAYGSDEISYAGPTPLPEWRRQLAALDALARTHHGRSFTASGVDARRALVRTTLEGHRLTGMPAPLRAPHVAVALMSHFYGSSEATDLCYGVQLGPNECRPLAFNGRRPLPLAGRAPR